MEPERGIWFVISNDWRHIDSLWLMPQLVLSVNLLTLLLQAVGADDAAGEQTAQSRTDSFSSTEQHHGTDGGTGSGQAQREATQVDGADSNRQVILGKTEVIGAVSAARSDSDPDGGFPHLAAGARSVLEVPPGKARTRGTRSKDAKKVDSGDPAVLQKYLRRYVNLGKAYMAIAEEYEDADLAADFAAQLQGGCQAALLAGLRVAPPEARACMEALKGLIVRGKEAEYDSAAVVAKLRQKLEAAESQTKTVDLQSKLFSQMAAKAVPKGMHCLAMKLMVEHMQHPNISVR